MPILQRQMWLGVGALLAACGGGGGDPSGGFSCAYMPGRVTSTAVANGTARLSSPQALADGVQSTATVIDGGVGQISGTLRNDHSGAAFPAGSKAGVLISFSGGASVTGITLSTYLDGSLRESTSSNSLNSESTNGATPADQYVSFETTLDFDSLELGFTAASGQRYTAYELCGDS